uniref:Uncharacterized protein n=1 Tax=Eucampia antarctica TaxID=49252 RepID=A0A7S2RKK8_9STRA|mmetsp:Transcript_23518/g.22552  ORF Transcript_23518/g.22552 Transcript_23518/m.22552 type:complete len:155 (+) Transcript_23518:107-571(+)|eukprot:CAMPEP_0197825376 /NCGR_PEP_ID=MMETSP1437-20131217/2476_1 /TAXON_ID=49252 ORGANISM="Eucampia antarctica, Strain CCMP1452" /NCGR_SAMPLE_ID=MMETSP1437 /ASSEMBLY_ACC=CAM_ASM_001096 /LENGTH=154 /DNA_ID=CAMNT_0043425353 /DNA_START=102 /DNA_END=566 /DNA_ORIENTATION=+
MAFGRIRDAFAGKPKLDGPSRLPEYFPVQPKGCERHAEPLFTCLANEATDNARDMEKAGLHKSYYPDVETTPGDEKAAQKVKEIAASGKGVDTTIPASQRLPTADDNPLDACRDLIAYYKRCCDRELKKKHNWILTEPYRVQEEYRYNQQEQTK